MPRIALWLFAAAYTLPGLFGRDPWKSADITAFGYMVNIAQGRSSWVSPSVGGLPPDGALLPYWLGAIFVKGLGAWIDPALAARIPFALLLILALALTWYAAYHLARSEAAQPLPFAFGGEAAPSDYARAIADGALLALIASLGLLQLGHETTPELAQLVSVALFLYALAACGSRAWLPRVAAMIALPALAASGAPSIAVALGVASLLVTARRTGPAARALMPWIAASTLLAAIGATAIGAWGWRTASISSWPQAIGMLRMFAWFTWPAWPLAVWTLWRWRRHLVSVHIALPFTCLVVFLGVWLGMGGSDRALMLALPSLAILAAFALPTLQRSASGAIDWFSVFFFTIAAITGWVVYLSIQLGVPAKPAANIARLSPGFSTAFSPTALFFAVIGTLAWLWLVHWRTGRSRHPLWKSMVLPAGGVSLCWLLVMTLLLSPLDNARSYRSLVQRVMQHVPSDVCVSAPGMPRAEIVALEYLGRYRVDAATPASKSNCEFMMLLESRQHPTDAGPGWQLLSRERRNRNDDEITAIYRRADPAAARAP